MRLDPVRGPPGPGRAGVHVPSRHGDPRRRRARASRRLRQAGGAGMIKLGYKASAEQFAPRPLVEFGVAAEAKGFDSIIVSDHFQPWKHTDGHAPFSFAWLAALGERTKRATIGTSVVTPTFRSHPPLVAQAIATLPPLYPHPVLPPAPPRQP